MDDGKLSICGEESFGTGSDHIREKDGVWAVLSWLSILRHYNPDASKPLVSVQDIVQQHWTEFGRNYYCRYDYEQVESDKANQLMESQSEGRSQRHWGSSSAASRSHPALRCGCRFCLCSQFAISCLQPLCSCVCVCVSSDLVKLTTTAVGSQWGSFTVSHADEFTYTDPVDKSVSAHQGVRFLMSDGSRVIFRLSGTGSVGATIRMYIEKYETDPAKLQQASAVRTTHTHTPTRTIPYCTSHHRVSFPPMADTSVAAGPALDFRALLAFRLRSPL